MVAASRHWERPQSPRRPILNGRQPPYPDTDVETTMPLPDLLDSHCIPRKGSEHALGPAAVTELLGAIPGWQLSDDGHSISRKFPFKDFHHTMAFVNAVAWIAHQEDHHPDMDVGYAHCALLFSTHDVGGLSMNDFICAAKATQLLERG